MLGSRIFKNLLSILLSLSLAWPVSSFATQPLPPPTPDAAEGSVPVLVERAILENGQAAYLLAAPVPKEQEPATVKSLAQHDPSHLKLVVDGAQDPALKAAIESGQLGLISTFQIDKVEEMPIFKQVGSSRALKERVIQKVKSIGQFAKDNAMGLFFSISYSSVVATSAYISAGIGAGLAVLIPFVLFNAFVATQQHKWDAYIEGSAEGHEKFFKALVGLFGKELSPASKKILATAGRFNGTYLATVAGVALVTLATGAPMPFIDVLFTGILFNYSIWDATVLKKYREGQISRGWVIAYYCLQYLGGSLAEAAKYLGYSQVEFLLAPIVLAGILWAEAGPDIEKLIARDAQKVKLAFGGLRSGARGRTVSLRRCADLLSTPTHSYAEDTW